MKIRFSIGQEGPERPPLFFWRDQKGHEVDLILDAGTRLHPIEIKGGQTIDPAVFAGLLYYLRLGPPVAETGVLIYGGPQGWCRGPFVVRPWHRCV